MLKMLYSHVVVAVIAWAAFGCSAEAADTSGEKTMTAGVCQPVPNYAGRQTGGDNALDPIAAAVNSLWSFHSRFRQMPKEQRREALNVLEKTAKITILHQPSHGTLTLTADLFPDPDPNAYFYNPEPGYFGKDRVVALVEMGQYKVKLVYSLYPVNHGVGPETEAVFCRKKGVHYRIVE